MAEIGGYFRYLIIGVLTTLSGGAIGYVLSNEYGYPFWPIIALCVTVALGIVSLALSYSKDGETVKGNQVTAEGRGDAIGGKQVIEGDKIQEQNIFLGHSDFRDLLWGQKPNIPPENLRNIADEMEKTAKSLREYADESIDWSLNLSSKVVQDIEKLPQGMQEQIFSKLSQLQSQINETGIPPEKLTSRLAEVELYRVRVDDYRVLLDINEDEKQIYILAIAHRQDVYDKISDSTRE